MSNNLKISRKSVSLGAFLITAQLAWSATPSDFIETGHSSAELTPKGYILESESKGDINKDGHEDMVLVLSTGKSACDSTFTTVYFGKPNNTYRLFAVYREGCGCTLMDEGEKNSMSEDVSSSRYGFEAKITSKGLLSIKEEWQFAVGSQQNITDTRLFRFQDGDLYCIGTEHKQHATWGGEAENGFGYSINYLTHKKYGYDIQHYNQVNGKWSTEEDLKPYVRTSMVKLAPNPSKTE